MAALSCLVALLLSMSACRPGTGDDAGVSVGGTDRIEVLEVVAGGWPPERRDDPGADDAAREHGRLLGVIRDPDLIDPIVDELDGVRFIDVGGHDYDMSEPDYEVIFVEGDEILERLGYYTSISRWGEHRVEGRWLKGWDPLATTVDLPTAALD